MKRLFGDTVWAWWSDSHRLLVRAEVLQLSRWTVGGEETPDQGMYVGPGASVPR